jgi:hypothetical protein
MKRLLIFMLVLSMTASANATLRFMIDGLDAGDSVDIWWEDTITIQIHDDVTTQAGYNAQVLLELGSEGTIGNGRIYPAAGSAGGIWPYSYGGYVGYNLTAMSISGDISPGIHFSVDYTAPFDFIGVETLSLYDERLSWAVADTLLIYVAIPEPTTLGLLALGGLTLLRRRRK